jgi:hypothetical protein
MAADPRRKRKSTFHVGPFCGRCRDMLESPAFDVLSRAALKIMVKLEVAHSHAIGTHEMGSRGVAKKGRSDANGKIVCTYRALELCGVHKNVIAPAIRELVALGFLEVTHKGAGGNADFRDPTLYRLTFLPTEYAGPTNEWRKFETMEHAERIAELARSAADGAVVARAKKQNFALTFCPVSPSLSEGEKATPPPSESEGSGPPSESEGSYIFTPRGAHLDPIASAVKRSAAKRRKQPSTVATVGPMTGIDCPVNGEAVTAIGHNDNLGERLQARSRTSQAKYRAVAGSIDLPIDEG